MFFVCSCRKQPAPIAATAWRSRHSVQVSRDICPVPSQASLAAALLVRDALVQLAPAEVEASLLAASRGGGGSHTLPALTPTVGGLHTGGFGAAGAAMAAAAGAGMDRTPTSGGQQAQHAQQGRRGGISSSPQAPGILFKAAATIKEELVLCELVERLCRGT